MSSRGFSLIELLIIMAILSILYAIGTLSFNAYQKRYRAEAQTRFLFSEIQKARVDAICQRRGGRLKVYHDHFELYSSQQDDTNGARPLQTYLFRLPVVYREDVDPYVIDIDSRGIIELEESQGSICLEDSDVTGGVDSITVSATKTSIGKKRRGYACISESITFK